MKNRIVNANQVIHQLCEAWGIGGGVTKMDIHLNINEAVRLETVQFVFDKDADMMVSVLKNYTLSEIPELKEVEYSDIDYTKCKFRKVHNGSCGLIQSAIYGKTCQMACGWMIEEETNEFEGQ